MTSPDLNRPIERTLNRMLGHRAPEPIERTASWPLVTAADLQPQRMKIRTELPPNIEAIEKVFVGVRKRIGVLYCYGDTIYNPTGLTVPIQLIAHECVHSVQQEKVGIPDLWWQHYLEDPEFRLAMELDAHRVEVQEFNKHNERHARRRYAKFAAERLSGPLYNNMLKKDRAKALILQTEN